MSEECVVIESSQRFFPLALYCRCYPPLSKLAAHTENRYETKRLTQQNTEHRKKKEIWEWARTAERLILPLILRPPAPSLASALITKLYVLIISFHQRKKGFSGSCSSHIFVFRRAGEGAGAGKTMKNISLFNKARRNRSCTLSEPSWASERQAAECLSIGRAHKLIESSLAFFFASPKPPARLATSRKRVRDVTLVLSRAHERDGERDWLTWRRSAKISWDWPRKSPNDN